MSQPKDHASDLDRHVQLLESKVNQLRASLTHWQQWYLDYSALKEEVEQLPSDPPPHEQLRRIRRDFDSNLLTKKEVNEIIGKNDLKPTEQIVSVLSRRMDYVEQNIQTLNKLLEKEENRLAAASVVAQPDAGTDEESGLPFTDIIEELDEEDNVVNFRLQSGADVGGEVMEALRKVGITEGDIPEKETPEGEASEQDASEKDVSEAEGKGKETSAPKPAQNEAKQEPRSAPERLASGAAEKPSADEPPTPKKSVSFAEDTKPGHNEAEPPVSHAAQQLERLMQKAKEQESMDMSSAVIPEDESDADSKLRREMLEYSMSEIGPVVAELQLEEGSTDDDEDLWVGSEDEFDEETDDDGEDELGRSKRSVITPDYIKRMQELEKRLNVQSAFTVGRSDTEPKKLDEGIGRISVVSEPTPSAATPAVAPATTPKEKSSAPKEKKSVSFASKLDIAPDHVSRPPPDTKPKERKIAYVGDVVEKTVEEEPVEEPEEPPKRVSRFKKERSAVASPSTAKAGALPPGPHQLPAKLLPVTVSPPPEPTPPKDQTLAHTIVERDAVPEPAEPDDMDETLLYQVAAVEYNRLRNKLIQKQGGFNQQEVVALDSETGRVPLDEELGGPKRMSKFKAARLAKLQ